MKQYTLILAFFLCLSKSFALDCNPPKTIFAECYSSTQPTCTNRNPQFIAADCNIGCVCGPGYYQWDGECVSEKRCDEIVKRIKQCEKIDKNSTWKECQSSTQKTCRDPNPIKISRDCNDMCVCKPGFLKNSLGKCVLPKDC